MRLRRITGMGLSELATRGRQEAAKRLDRWTRTRDGIGGPGAGGRQEDLAAEGAFFAGAASDEVARLLARRMPVEHRRILDAAEAALQERFDLLGYARLDFGHPPDWHHDPVSGRRAKRTHWSRIDPLDFAEVGDNKVIWELNRHQWLVTMGQAYRLTGDERFAEAFARHVRSWSAENPRGMGINWASSLEVALRLISWSWASQLFGRSPHLDRELRATLRAGLAAHAGHVERYLSTYFSPNTHLTGEALGLVYAGTVLRGWPRARRWLQTGQAILTEQMGRQVLADGAYFEQATCYARYTAEIGLHALVLAVLRGEEAPRAIRERVERLLDYLLHVRRPDGGLPAIGDADGGWLLPLVPRRAPDDLRGVFAVAAAVFGRSDYAWAAEAAQAELLWVLGSDGLAAFDALAPRPPAATPSRLFPDAGWAVMSSGWHREAHQLVFDVGPLGCPVSGAHGHADLLSVQCSAFGEPRVLDPGTYLYTPDPVWRDYFRSTAAHSTVVVDGQGQARPDGPFAWRERPRATLRHWLSTDAVDFADALHGAYRRLADPVVHRRRVVFVKPRYFVLVDDLEGGAEHRLELRFQLAQGRVTPDADGWVRIEGQEGRGLLVRTFARLPLVPRVVEGGTVPIEGWVAPDYGRRSAAPVLVYALAARLPFRILTLLLPTARIDAATPTVSALGGNGRGPAGLLFEDAGECLRFEDEGGGPLTFRLERGSKRNIVQEGPPCAASSAS